MFSVCHLYLLLVIVSWKECSMCRILYFMIVLHFLLFSDLYFSFILSVCHVIMETPAVLFPFLPHPSFPPYPTPRHHPSPRPPLTAIITPTTRPQAKSPSLCLRLSEATPAAKPSGAALPQVPLNDSVSLPGSANNPYHLLTLCISSESHHLSTPYPS